MDYWLNLGSGQLGEASDFIDTDRSVGSRSTLNYPEDEVDELLMQHIQVRPPLLHTPGWWMTSRISRGGEDPGPTHDSRSDGAVQ